MRTRIKKQLTAFRPRVFSRHPSHAPLRTTLALLPFRSAVRFGSTTSIDEERYVTLNSVEGVQNSSNKLLMKQIFTSMGVSTADWWTIRFDRTNQVYKLCPQNKDDNDVSVADLPYPIVVKAIYGSKGRGNTKIDTADLFGEWLLANYTRISTYVVEKYYSYNKEYRIHVTEEGCFYTCRKMLKEDTPKEDRWHRHDSNSVWMLEENPLFGKPENWNEIVADCVAALKALKLDICGFDVKIQSKEHPKWIILESNSACSMNNEESVVLQKYLEQIPKTLTNKFERRLK